MATYHASATRWLKRYSAPTLTPVSATPSASSEALRQLKSAPWRMVARDLSPTVAPPRPAAGSVFTDSRRTDYFDAYFGCDDHAEDAGVPVHRAHAGAACYRVALPEEAAGIGVSAVRVTVTCDYLTPQGARVAAALSDSPAPSADQATVRLGDASASAVAPRTVSADGRTGYGATGAAELAMPEGAVLGGYLYVYLTLEGRPGGLSGWLEGSAFITPDIEIVTAAEIPGFADGSQIGGGYGAAPAPAMLVSGGELPAPWAAAPYREIAVIERDIWEAPPVPKRLELSLYSKWLDAAGGPFTVTVTSLPDNWLTFSVGELPAWLTAAVNSSARAVTLTAAAADPGASRSADITISSGPETATLHVDQQADEITYLAVTPASLSFPAGGGVKTFTVTSLPNGVSEFSFTKSAGADWLTLAVDNVDSMKVNATASAQAAGAAGRQASVVFSAGAAQVAVYAGQDAGEALTYFYLALDSFNLTHAESACANPVASFPNGLDIGDVAIVSAPAWITATVDSVNGEIDCAVAANGGGARWGTVRVSCGGTLRDFTVSQSANPSALSVSPAEAQISGDGGALSAALTFPDGATDQAFSGGSGVTGSISEDTLSVTVAANSGEARTVTCTVTCKVGGVEQSVSYVVLQGGRTFSPLASRLARLTTSSVAAFGPSATTDSGISHVSTHNGLCMVSGSFTSLFGWRGMCPLNTATGAVITASSELSSWLLANAFRGIAAAGFSSGRSAWAVLGTKTGGVGYAVLCYENSGSLLISSAAGEWWGWPSSPAPVSGYDRFVGSSDMLFSICTTSKKAYKWTATYKWGGQNGSQLGGSFSSTPSAIAISPSLVIYVAGNGLLGAGSNLAQIAPAGTAWSPTAQSAYIPPASRFTPDDWTGLSIAFTSDGCMVAAGAFTSIGGNSVPYLAKWDGSNWVPFGSVRPGGAVRSIAADGYGGLILLTAATPGYLTYTPPPARLEPDLDPLPPLSLDERQAVCGVRDLYAAAFAGQITAYDFTSAARPARQPGLCACLRRDASAAGGPDRARLMLSALFARLEIPETFTPGSVALTPPPLELLRLPAGTMLDLTVWWSRDTHLSLADIAAVSHEAAWWAGTKVEVTGERTFTLGQTDVSLRASFRRIGRASFGADVFAWDSIDIPVQGLDGLHGTLAITAWLCADQIASIPAGEAWGVGLMDAVEGGLSGTDTCWRPSVTLLG